MITIAPCAENFYRCLIANGLSRVFANNSRESIVVDFSVLQNGAFWSVYGSGLRYVENVLEALASANPKMLKNFLSGTGGNFTLGLKDAKLSEIQKESLEYLFSNLKAGFENLIVIMPDEYSLNAAYLYEQSKTTLLPFMSDIVSARKAIDAVKKLEGADITPFELKLEREFHSDTLFLGNDLFQKREICGFSFDTQKQIFSPKFSYKDNSFDFTASLNKILQMYDKSSQKTRQAADADSRFFESGGIYKKLKDEIYAKLVEEMKQYAKETDAGVLRETAKNKINAILKDKEINLSKQVADKLIKELSDNVAGLGVLEDFINDESVTEIMVNGARDIYVEKAGKLSLTGVSFADERQLKTIIERIVSYTGRHIDEAEPIVDARLRDGSRVNAVIRPISLDGNILTIRKFSKNKMSADSLIDSGSISREMVEFLKLAVLLKKNIIISGGTGTGKTTLLNAVSSFIPEKERLVTIEDSAELQLKQKHTVRLESRPKSTEGTGEITIRRLVTNALRMRPDRIIVGECRSGEALDMIQAMNTGHEGSMSTVHANSPKDAVSRLVTMVLMSGMDLPERSIVNQIVSAINIIVQLSRFADGSRKISSISFLNPVDNEKQYEVIPVFEYRASAVKDGVQKGEFKAAGFIPDFVKEAQKRGIAADLEIFK